MSEGGEQANIWVCVPDFCLLFPPSVRPPSPFSRHSHPSVHRGTTPPPSHFLLGSSPHPIPPLVLLSLSFLLPRLAPSGFGLSSCFFCFHIIFAPVLQPSLHFSLSSRFLSFLLTSSFLSSQLVPCHLPPCLLFPPFLSFYPCRLCSLPAFFLYLILFGLN